MNTITVSPKYQIVLPKLIREHLKLFPGQKLQALEVDGRIELIPLISLKKARGMLKGLSSDPGREKKDRKI